MEMKMKSKSTPALVTAAFLMLGLTGCAENQIPDMTDAQMQSMGEFLAVKLVRYDMGRRSRLMDLSEYGNLDWTLDEPEGQEPEEPETGMKPVEDTPVVDSAGKEDTNPINSLEDVLGLPPGVTVLFAGDKTCAYYPEDEEASYFSLNASEGKKLLVLSFSVTNSTEQEQVLDILGMDVNFQIGVNGEYTRRALTTLMENDLATYRGTLAAGESHEMVLVIEVGEEMAENIASISLNVKNDTQTYSMQLR